MPAIKRVRFISIPAPGARVLLELGEPFNSVAVLEEAAELNFENAAAPANLSGPDFECALVEAKTADDKAARWLRAAAPVKLQPSESVCVRTESGARVECRSGRVLVALPAETSTADQEALLKALAEFFFLQHELTSLEGEINGQWGQAKTDLPLASDVHSKDLDRLNEVAGTTRAVWLRRIRLAQLERPMLRSQVALPPGAKKLAARLRRAFDVEGRLEILDGQIECFEYIYEMTNQRMGEYKNFRREFVVEILIALLLAMEVVLMGWDFIRHYHDH